MQRKMFWNLVAQGLDLVSGYTTLILLSAFLTVEKVGVWVLFSTTLFLTTKMREGMIQNALTKFSQQDNAAQKNKTYQLTLKSILSIELAIFAIIFTISFFIPNADLATLFRWYIIISLPQGLNRFTQQCFQSELKNKALSISNFALTVSLTLSAYIILNAGFELIHLSAALGFIYLLIALGRARFIQPIKIWFSSSDTAFPIQSFQQYMIHGFLREFIGTLSSRAYIYIAGFLGGISSSAFMGIANRYANFIYLPNTAFQGVLYPKACKSYNRENAEELSRFYREQLAYEYLFYIIYAPLFIAGAWFVIPFLHGSEFIASVPFLTLLTIHGAFLAPLGHAFGSIMHVVELPQKVTQLIGFSSVLNIILMIAFSFAWGIWGTLYANVLTDLIGLIVMYFIMKKNQIPTFFPNWNTFLTIKKFLFT